MLHSILSCKALPCWQCIYHVVNLIFLFQIHNFQSILETSLGSKEDERNVFAALQVRNMSWNVTKKGSRGRAIVRVLVSRWCGSGSAPVQCHVWAEFVVGVFSEAFLSVSRFSSFLKIQHSTFQFDQGLASSLSIVICYLLPIFIYFY